MPESTGIMGNKPWVHPLVLWGLMLVLCLASGCSNLPQLPQLPQVSAEARLFLPLSLEFVSAYELPKQNFENVPIGGLSGLTYDGPKGLFYAISDDRSNFAPARFYTLKLRLDTNETTQVTKIKTLEVKAMTTLLQADGKPYAKNTSDTEGIALAPDQSVYVSSEGVAKDGIPPFINQYDLQTGALKYSLPISAAYIPKTQDDGSTAVVKVGVQNNLGFEALTLNAGAAQGLVGDPLHLFAAVESSLEQDKEPPSPEAGAQLRFLHYSIQGQASSQGPSSTLVSEYVYRMEPKPAGVTEQGLSEILSVDQAGHFISLERTFGLAGFGVKLFQVTTAGAMDVSRLLSLRGLPSPVQPLRKQLMLDLKDLGVTLDNLEAMTLGPLLPDGSPSLVLISDDNFSKDQATQILLFRLKGLT
jgi:hypothetical protein